MKRRSRILAIAALVLIAGAIGTYFYVFRTGSTDILKEKTDFRLGADILLKEFQDNEQDATAKYGGKVLEVSGTVEMIEKNEWGNVTVTFLDLLFGVTCTIDSLDAVNQSDKIQKIATGDSLTIKGRCDGMLTDVKLVRCKVLD